MSKRGRPKFIDIGRGKKCLVDAEDYEWLNARKWHLARRHAAGYRNLGNGTHTCTEYMHKVIMPCPAGYVVDHINGNSLDNRRQNLRICTFRQNLLNRRAIARSGLRGVHWITAKKKWRAEIKLEGRTRHLGYFTDKIEAARRYDEVARQYFGEYGRYNNV